MGEPVTPSPWEGRVPAHQNPNHNTIPPAKATKSPGCQMHVPLWMYECQQVRGREGGEGEMPNVYWVFPLVSRCVGKSMIQIQLSL